MLESDKFVDDDDFGDLYLDVEVKATCTLKQLLEEEEENLDSAEPKESDSESEDGLDIVLNDDKIGGKTFDGNHEVNAEDFGDDCDEVDGMKNDEDAGCGAQFKLMRPCSQSRVSLSCVNSNVPAKAATHSTLARGNWDDKTCGSGFISGSKGAQRCRNITLPRHRTILDINIDALEGKPWRLPGVDITDYFNFGLDEDSWKSYCNHLDDCRGKISDVNVYPAYNPSRLTKQDEVGSEHKLLAEAATGIDTQSIRALPPSHPKGKAIEVKEGIGDRQPSVGAWNPVERGLDVIIQIPLQNSEEDLPTSAKGAVDGNSSFVLESSDFKDSGDVAHSDGGDAICFASPSEGRLPCLEVSSEDTQRSLPERCFNSVCMESVDCGSPQGSEADECGKLDALESFSDGSSEATTSSSDPEEDISGVKPLTATRRKDLETTDAELRVSSPSPSSSRSYDSASRYGAYVEADRVHGRSKKVSLTSSLEAQDTVRRVYHSSKDSKSLGNRRKSSHSENFTRSRSPIRRNHTFHQSRSCKSRSPIRRNHTFHRSRSSRSRNPIRRNYKFHQDRSSIMAGLKSYPDNQDACYEFHDLPHHTIGHLTGRNRHQGFKYSEREEFWHEKRSKETLYCGGKRFEDRLSGEELDSLHYDYTGEFIAEQLPIPDHRKHAPRKGKLDEMHLTRRRGSNKLTRGCIYKNDYSLEDNGGTPSYARERDVVEYKHDRLLSYPLREADSTRKFDRVYGTIRNRDWEDQKVKHSGKPFPLSSVKYHNGGRVSFLRGDVLGSEVAQMQDRCFERYSESELGGWDAAFHDVEDTEHLDDQDNIEHHEDQDIFSGKKQCLESEELHWREERYSYWHKDVDFQAEGTLNPLKRSLRGKRFGFIHDQDRKLIRYDYKQKRCKLLRKGKNDSSQFLQNSNFTQKVIVKRTVPGNWKSTDKHMVVGNLKSSRCENLDRNDHSGQRISEDSNESHIVNTVRADNRSKTFKGGKRDESSDIEEGQIIVKETPCTNPRILEMIAKMEKRRERFKQPLVNVTEKNGCPSADNVTETMDSKKIQRPARKRKWIAG